MSLNWIFDHIDGDVRAIDVLTLVNKFIQTTAEIEEYRAVSFNPKFFTLAEVIHVSDSTTVVCSPEFKKEYTLAARSDAQVGLWYLLENKNDQFAWATIYSVGGTKDTLLPAVFVEESQRTGGWKKTIELSDYIIDIDNKSINHRPDLWGHRGIAREVAAILDMPMHTIDIFIDNKQKVIKKTVLEGNTGQFSVAVANNDVCKRFAALYVDTIENRPSSLDMIIRLSRLDSKAIDCIVDCTNYVMFDLGQPMHAFDAQLLSAKNINVRCAHEKEMLTVLDGQAIQLSSHDVVIADGDKAVSLAGVMGGITSGINIKTTSLLLEAANFDAVTVRRTAARHKKRTEASMRFEKSLDPHHLDHALLRFLFLLQQHGITYTVSSDLIVLGQDNHAITIEVEHVRIEQILGVAVAVEQVCDILKKLCFGVEQRTKNNACVYTITVPSFRATKDVTIEEDIIEEVGRYVGYDAIAQVMPLSRLTASDLQVTYATRAIKRLLSNGLQMRELYGYSFFDEAFLHELGWEPDEYVEIKNPISENYTRLVTTLQPHLLKAVRDNSIHHLQLRFYELGRVWHGDNNEFVEKKSVSGIFFDQSKKLDFYEGKALLLRLFKELSCDVEWKHNDNSNVLYPWLSVYQTASLMHNNICIGMAGMLQERVVNALSNAGGTIFIFECDADYLINYKHPVKRFVPLPKYPAVYRDISLMIPISVAVDVCSEKIKQVDERIKTVTLIDLFTKKEWEGYKSLTFHIEMQDDNKTLDHDEVEVLWNSIVDVVKAQGAEIR